RVDRICSSSLRIRTKDQRVGLGAHGFSAEGRATGGKARVRERGECDPGDRWSGIACREGVDNPSLSEIACFAIAVEVWVFEIRIEFGEDLGDENRVVGDVAGASICDRDGGGSAADLHRPV